MRRASVLCSCGVVMDVAGIGCGTSVFEFFKKPAEVLASADKVGLFRLKGFCNRGVHLRH